MITRIFLSQTRNTYIKSTRNFKDIRCYFTILPSLKNVLKVKEMSNSIRNMADCFVPNSTTYNLASSLALLLTDILISLACEICVTIDKFK